MHLPPFTKREEFRNEDKKKTGKKNESSQTNLHSSTKKRIIHHRFVFSIQNKKRDGPVKREKENIKSSIERLNKLNYDSINEMKRNEKTSTG